MELSRCLGEPDGKRGVHGVKSKATEKALQSTLLLPIPEIPYRYPHVYTVPTSSLCSF